MTALHTHATPPTDLIAQGMSLQQAADAEGAATCYARAVELDPANVQAHFLCALVAVQQDRLEQARSHLDAACALDPGHGQAAMLRGHVLDRLAEHSDALVSLDTAAALMPQSAMVWNYRAQTLYSLRRYDEALASCDRVLSLDPDRSDTLFLRGVLLHMLGRSSEAMQALNPLFMKQPDDPNLHELMAQICLAGVGRGQPESELFQHAQKYLDTAIALEPDRATAHEARGSILERTGDPQAALESYRRALAIRPDRDDAAYAMGRCLLALGDWENGWAAHERRWFRRNAMAWRRQTGAPLWRGEPLAGKSIAIVAERGFGDVIQFYRFVEPVRALAASMSVVLPPALHRLLGPAVDLGRTPAHRFDYHCPLLSLAHRLGTTADNMPGAQGYLQADPALSSVWQQRLGPKTRLRVGVFCRGDPTNGNDHNRSMPLQHLAPLMALENVEFICLQQVMSENDLSAHASMPRLAFYGRQLHDFAETAALCDNLDLVISVCSSVAHLAGAMGKPVWILLTQHADWRWMQGREDSPWYARARLFRQSQQGDWDGVIRRVRDGLIDAAAAAAR